MSGSIRGKVDILTNAGNSTRNAQEFFKGLYDFMVGHPQMTLVARNCGAGSAVGDIGYWDQPNPFGNNAWAVFELRPTLERPYPVFFQIQWASSTFGAAPGSPGSVDGSTASNTVAIQAAIGVGGDQNPWAGTQSGGALNDVRADPVWKLPSSGGTEVHVFPRTNNVGGAFNASKSSFSNITTSSGLSTRYHILADNDSLVILFAPGDTANWRMYFAGIYDVHPSTGIYRAYCSFGSVNNIIPFTAGSLYGRLDGQGAQGGLIHAFGGMRGMAFDRIAALLTSTVQPENLVSADSEFGEHLEHGLSLCSSEPALFGISASGFAGQLGFVREVANVDSGDSSTDFLRAAFGSSTKSAIKVTVPWSGVAPPGDTSTREGFDFERFRVPSDDPVIT